MNFNLISISAILLIASCFISCDKDDGSDVGYNCVNGKCMKDNANPIFATLSDCESSCSEVLYPAGTVNCNPSTPTAVVDVLNPATGRIWMDRNLGASRVATSSTDEEAFGDLYQWGRGPDGHQCRNSPTSTVVSSSDTPGHEYFILPRYNSGDWRSPFNNNLWQVDNGINNPCPNGYRIPTEGELNAEWLSWSSLTVEGAFSSPLKLTVAGWRDPSDGSLSHVGYTGHYWSSTSIDFPRYLLIFSSVGGLESLSKANGFSVRCIKD